MVAFAPVSFARLAPLRELLVGKLGHFNEADSEAIIVLVHDDGVLESVSIAIEGVEVVHTDHFTDRKLLCVSYFEEHATLTDVACVYNRIRLIEECELDADFDLLAFVFAQVFTHADATGLNLLVLYAE